jgi:hypothetical protein
VGKPAGFLPIQGTWRSPQWPGTSRAEIVRLRAPWLTRGHLMKAGALTPARAIKGVSRTGRHSLQHVAGPARSACGSRPGQPAGDGRISGRQHRWGRSHWPDGANRQRHGDLGRRLSRRHRAIRKDLPPRRSRSCCPCRTPQRTETGIAARPRSGRPRSSHAGMAESPSPKPDATTQRDMKELASGTPIPYSAGHMAGST